MLLTNMRLGSMFSFNSPSSTIFSNIPCSSILSDPFCDNLIFKSRAPKHERDKPWHSSQKHVCMGLSLAQALEKEILQKEFLAVCYLLLGTLHMAVTQHILISHASLIPCGLTEADSAHHCSCKISLEDFSLTSALPPPSRHNLVYGIGHRKCCEAKKFISHQKIPLW